MTALEHDGYYQHADVHPLESEQAAEPNPPFEELKEFLSEVIPKLEAAYQKRPQRYEQFLGLMYDMRDAVYEMKAVDNAHIERWQTIAHDAERMLFEKTNPDEMGINHATRGSKSQGRRLG